MDIHRSDTVVVFSVLMIEGSPSVTAVESKRPSNLPADRAGKTATPVVYWAVAGAALLAFQIYVLGRWVTGPNFKRTEPAPGADISAGQEFYFLALQVIVPIAMVICLYWWVVRPCRAQKTFTTDAMIATSAVMIFFWDLNMNYTSTSLLYNAHFFNRGSWSNGSWPGWTSPGGELLPEPLFLVIPGYTVLVFGQVVFILWLLRKAQARWPGMGMLGKLATIVLGLTIVDTIIEVALIRTGVYAYPGAIRQITLFAGQTYQMPLSESLFFSGISLGAVAALSHFRDDRGRTVVERGLQQLSLSTKQKQTVKFLAIFGAVHLAYLVFYMVPNQWLATHSDAFPAGYPSYMINNMCQAGLDGKTCPGPGVPIPRP